DHAFGYEAKVFNAVVPSHSEYINIVDGGQDEFGKYVVSEKPATLDHTVLSYTVFTPSDDTLYKEIVESAQELRNLGFDVHSISYPYNANSRFTRSIVRKHLASGRSGSGLTTGAYMDTVNGYLPTQQLNSYAECTRWT